MEKLPISKTKSEYIRIVFPEHANSIGTLYGGYMMRWILDAGMLTATRFTKGPCVIGSMDSIDFIRPVRIGNIVKIESFVEYVGNTSLEVGLKVFSGEFGDEKIACTSHLSFIAMNEKGDKREIETKVFPDNEEEKIFYEEAIKRRNKRKERIEEWRKNPPEFEIIPSKWSITTERVVFPEDTLYLKRVYGGKVLMIMDELAAILARKYAKGICVTASLDEMDFFAPAYIGEILHIQATISAVFRTSMEIFIKVFAENPEKEEIRNVVTSFMVFVHLDENGEPKSLPEFHYQKLLESALERKRMRIERRKRLDISNKI